MKKDVSALGASTPVVVFAHVPLWTVYPQWGWGTEDGARALDLLKRFGSVTVLNGHIHQVLQKVEGNVTFHTARSTAFPQPEPGKDRIAGTDEERGGGEGSIDAGIDAGSVCGEGCGIGNCGFDRGGRKDQNKPQSNKDTKKTDAKEVDHRGHSEHGECGDMKLVILLIRLICRFGNRRDERSTVA